MDDHKNPLTRQQEWYVAELMEKGTSSEAAKGLYLPQKELSEVKNSKEVRRGVADRARQRLQTDGVATAVKTMMELMGASNPPAVRLNASIKVLELAGIRPPDPGDLGDHLDNLSAAQLEAIVSGADAALTRLGDAARPVSSLIQGVAQRSADPPPADEPEPGAISEG